MKAHTKTLLILLSLSALVILLIFIYAKGPMTDTYRNLEREKMETIVHQVNDRLHSEYENLDHTAVDYATWDDMYEFAKKPNEEFKASGIGVYAHEANHFDAILVFNSSYDLIFGRNYDHSTKVENRLPAELLTLTTKEKLLKYNEEDEDHFGVEQTEPSTDLDGIISIEGLPMIIAVESIFDSQRKGPSTGWLFIGRLMDVEETAELSEELKYPIKIHNIANMELESSKKEAISHLQNSDSKIFISEFNDTRIAFDIPMLPFALAVSGLFKNQPFWGSTGNSALGYF